MIPDVPREEPAQPLVDGGPFPIVALACWCLGWIVRLCYLLVSPGWLATLLGYVSQILLWGSFGSVLVAIVVRLIGSRTSRRGDDR